MTGNNMMPPVPRDHDEASFSEMVPIRSSKIKLWKSPLFLFGLVTALVTVSLFNIRRGLLTAETLVQAKSEFMLLSLVVTGYILLMTVVALMIYSRSDRRIWYIGFPALVLAIVLMTPIGAPFFIFFRSILPGNPAMVHSKEFVTAFVGMFFAAGLMEELMKALPILIGAALTIYGVKMRNTLSPMIYDLIRVRGPLDAVLMALGSGAAFVFIETGGEYVPKVVEEALQRGGEREALGAFGLGLMLLLPRVFNALAGHIGYAVVFGYFIGLAVIRPKGALKLLAIGWLTSSILHALWNSVSNIHPWLQYVIAALTIVALVACVLKARELEASIFGRGSADTGGSIVVGAPGSGPMPPRPAYVPPPMGAMPTPVPAAAPAWAPAGPLNPVGAPPPAMPPPPIPQAMTQQTIANTPLALNVAGINMALTPGARLDLGTIASLGGAGGGVLGEVTVHPRNPGVIGMKNLGVSTWYVRMRDNSVQPVGPQKNVRLVPGTSVDFGNGILGTVTG